MNELDYISLIHNKLKGNISSEELRRLEEWVDDSSENQAYYQSIVSTWEGISPLLFQSEDIDVEAALEVTMGKMDMMKPHRAKRRRMSRMMLAAGFLIIVSFGYFLFNYWTNIESNYFPASDTVQILDLDDGSSVKLNIGSSLTFEQQRNRRVAKLDGEGFFEVKSNPELPFMVATDFGTVEVVGTKFNVQELASSQATLISVVEGKVICRNIDETDFSSLTTGNSALINSSEVRLLERSIENVTSWYSGILLFQDKPMNEVVEDLAHHFKINLSLENTSLANCPFNTRMQNPDLEDAFFALKEVFGVNIVTLENNKYIIKGGYCN